MGKEIRIFKSNDIWNCELWAEKEEPFMSGKSFVEGIKANDFPALLVEIGNKNWLDLLNK